MDAVSEESHAGQGLQLLEAARRRREHLNTLSKALQPPFGAWQEPSTNETAFEEAKGAEDVNEILMVHRAAVVDATVESQVRTLLKADLAPNDEYDAGADATRGLSLESLAPRKANWDLKRDLEKKHAKLDRQTQRAMAELIRQRLAASTAQRENWHEEDTEHEDGHKVNAQS